MGLRKNIQNTGYEVEFNAESDLIVRKITDFEIYK